MKTLILTIAFLNAFTGVDAKEHFLKSHVDLIMALSEIKSNSESIKTEIKTWNGEDAQKAKAFYFALKAKNDALIDKYKTIIPSWRKAKKIGINVDNELKELEVANNEFVKFFTDNYLKYNQSPRLNITAELVNLIFDTGRKLYEFVKGIPEEQKKLWSTQVEQQRVKAW